MTRTEAGLIQKKIAQIVVRWCVKRNTTFKRQDIFDYLKEKLSPEQLECRTKSGKNLCYQTDVGGVVSFLKDNGYIRRVGHGEYETSPKLHFWLKSNPDIQAVYSKWAGEKSKNSNWTKNQKLKKQTSIEKPLPPLKKTIPNDSLSFWQFMHVVSKTGIDLDSFATATKILGQVGDLKTAESYVKRWRDMAEEGGEYVTEMMEFMRTKN